MTIIEMQTMQIIKTYLPQIAGALVRIANDMEKKVDEEPTTTCCICGKSFKGHGHNASPVKDKGKCCDNCNSIVLLARYDEWMHGGKKVR